MKKSVLLGLAAVTLFALPALAGETKYEGDWPGHWTWHPEWEDVCVIPVKMVIPWYVHLVDQDPIWLDQVDCQALGRDPAVDWPCFRGCKEIPVECNFNLTMVCGVNTSYIGGLWGCSCNPEDIDMPGGETRICVTLRQADLLGAPANTEQHVADVTVMVKPRL